MPILSDLFIDDPDEGAEVAANIELGGVVDTPGRCAAIQENLDRMEKWMEQNLMTFIKGKCKVLPMNNSIHQYML